MINEELKLNDTRINFNVLEHNIASYSIEVLQVVKSVSAAVYLQNIAFWAEVANKAGREYVYKSWRDVEKETGLTVSQQNTAKKKLLEYDLICCLTKKVPLKLASGDYKMTPVSHFKVNYKKLTKLLERSEQTKFIEESIKQECLKLNKPIKAVNNINNSASKYKKQSLVKYEFIEKLKDKFEYKNIKLPNLTTYQNRPVGVSSLRYLYYKDTTKDLSPSEAKIVLNLLYKQYLLGEVVL